MSGMGRFVCQVCESEHQVRVIDLVIVACCELCGVLRGDWGWKRVAMTFCHLFTHATALRRAKLLRQIAELESDLRRAGRGAGSRA